MMDGSRSVQIMMDPDPEGPKTYESGRPTNLRIREAHKLANPGGLKTYGSGSITLNKTALFQNPLDEGPFSIGFIFKYRTVRTNSVPIVVSVTFYLNSSISFFVVYEHQYYVTPYGTFLS